LRLAAGSRRRFRLVDTALLHGLPAVHCKKP
jgi:hypothetical protein